MLARTAKQVQSLSIKQFRSLQFQNPFRLFATKVDDE
jgi:thioredoxin